MGKATYFWNSKLKAWIFKSSGGQDAGRIGDAGWLLPSGRVATMQNISVPTAVTTNGLNLGGGGVFTKMKKHTGTIALAAIGTHTRAVATVSGLGSAGIAVGALVLPVAKSAISDVGIVGAYVPTTNVVNVYIMNASDEGGGSLPATGVDILEVVS